MVQRMVEKSLAATALLLLLFTPGWAADSKAKTAEQKQQEVDHAVEQRVLQLNTVLATAEVKMTDARKAFSLNNYEVAAKTAQEAKALVEPLQGPLAASKLHSIVGFINSVNYHWARQLLNDARKAYIAGKYEATISNARKAVAVDSSCDQEADSIIKLAEKKLSYVNVTSATSINRLDPDYAKTQDEIKVMLREAQILINNKLYDRGRDVLEKILLKDPFNQRAVGMLNELYQQLYSVADKRRQIEYEERMEQLEYNWSEQVPPVEGTKIDNVVPEADANAKANLQEKMQRIIFDNLEFDEASITSVVQHLNTLSKQADPDGTGVSIVSNLTNAESAEVPRITMSFDHIPMSEALRYICQGAGLKYKIEEKAVIIGDKNIDPMDTRFFKVRAALVASILQSASDSSLKTAEDRDNFTDKDGGSKTDLKDTFKKKGSSGSSKSSGSSSAKTETVAGGGVGNVANTSSSNSGDALKEYFVDRGINFDEGSTIAYDRRAGKLIVKNTYENLRKLEHLLRDLDISTPLVLVEAKIVEMTQLEVEELGFDWVFASTSNINSHWNVPANETILRHYSADSANSDATGQSTTSANGTVTTATDDRAYRVVNNLQLLPGSSDFSLGLTVNAIDQHEKQEVLSAPKVIATSGTTALIRMVEEWYFPTSWSDPELSVSSSSVQFTPPKPDFGDKTDIGIRFEVTPTVSPNNYTISLHLIPQVIAFSSWMKYPIYMKVGNTVIGDSSSTSTNYSTNIMMPIISRRDLDTNVKVFDGETIVLGGMLQDQAVERNDKWPILGDIPLVGRLFSSQLSDSEKVNLLIFVTARLVNNDGVPVRENSMRGLPDFNR